MGGLIMRHVNRVVLQCIGVIVAACLGPVFMAPAVAGDCPFDWRPDEAVPGIETAVTCLVTWDSDGAGPQKPLLVAGGRTKVAENVYTGGVATWNGLTWQALGSGMNDQVNAVGAYNGVLIAGGWFTLAGGNPANCIAWWDGTSWQQLGGGLGSPNFTPRVLSLITHGGNLLVGGAFRTAAGLTTSRSIVTWDGQNWLAMNTGFNAAVQAITVFGGEIIAGGGFTAIAGGGTSINHIARWTGTTWQALPVGAINGANNDVFALTVYDSKLIAGGSFTTAGGSSANSIALWDGIGWNPLGDGLTGNVPTIHALTVYDGRLIAGGRFTSAGGKSAINIAQWDGFGWQPLGDNLNRRVESLILSDGDLVAGGFFTAGSEELGRVARWGPACPRGDMNCDQSVDVADIPLFVQAVLSAPGLSTCDSYTANLDASVSASGVPTVDGLDVRMFVDAVVGS
jgi:hypothetical protein